MKLKYRWQMLTNMAAETWRLLGLWASLESVQRHWGMANNKGFSGQGHRLVTMSNGKYLGRDMRPTNFCGDAFEVPRDHLDIIWDFCADYMKTLYENVWKHERCSHPHEDVVVEWDGDEEIGWIKRTRCWKCGGAYLGGPEDVDRYMDEEDRRPDLITVRPEPGYPQDYAANDVSEIDYKESPRYAYCD